MIVTSDSTAPVATKIGKSMPTIRVTSGARTLALAPSRRPSTTNTITGIASVPNSPSGSRAKIFISIHVSFQSPRIIWSVPHRVAGDFQEHIFQGRRQPLRLADGDAAGRKVPRHQRLRRIDLDDAPVVDDGHAIAEPLRLLHRMRRQHHGLAAIAD